MDELKLTNNTCKFCNCEIDEGKPLCGDLVDLGDVCCMVKAKEGFEIACYQIKILLKIVRHQKYKRCFAMAEWCDTEVGIADTAGNYEDMLWYQKWYKRWLKLAEKFKEEK